jgi:AraC-like DNA-binding protein
VLLSESLRAGFAAVQVSYQTPTGSAGWYLLLVIPIRNIDCYFCISELLPMATGRRLPSVALDLGANRGEAIKRHINGTFSYYHLQPGLSCRVDNGIVENPFTEVSTMPSRQLMLQFRLKSPSAVRYEAGERQRRLGPHFAVILMRPGTSKQESFDRGQRDTVITLHCEVDFLEGILADRAPSLPAWLRGFLRGEENVMHRSHRLSAAMRSAANDILTAKSDGFLFDLLLRAKSEELLWHGLLTVCSDRGEDAPVAGLSNTESEKIDRAKELILQSFPEVPPLAKIASEIKLSAWKLNRGFKAIHGMTASHFVLELRMQRARELLAEEQHSIRDVAIEVGYDYLTNFSKAFKRHSGLSPRAFRESH